MDISVLIFLSSGLFLGWSLGANDAANVFGTAVGTRMVRFGIAATICGVFITLGAVISGAGTTHTLGALGAVNAIAGSFVAALSAGATVYIMTRLEMPVSTSQAIVGSIIGWNLFSGFPTDTDSLLDIVLTWAACPVLAAVLGAVLYKLTMFLVKCLKMHLFRLDAYTRLGLILAGAFGSYSLGANNIANVMGVFLASNPFTTFSIGGILHITAVQQLFLVGAVAIAIGVYTYSRRVMMTVGSNLMPLTPLGAWIVVVAHSITLFLFSSQGLEHFLASHGLPTIPLVPVSSSQAVVGAVIGIGLLKGGRTVKWHVLVGVASGWITTPLIAGLVCFFALFFIQNVFQQQVYNDASYLVSQPVLERLSRQGIASQHLEDLRGVRVEGVKQFRGMLKDRIDLSRKQERIVLATAQYDEIKIHLESLSKPKAEWLTGNQLSALRALEGRSFGYKWALAEALSEQSREWVLLPDEPVNKLHNQEVNQKLKMLYQTFSAEQ